MVSLHAMQEHAEGLCEEHGITWNRAAWVRKAIACREWWMIETPLIRGPVSYAAVMHEIGHILGRYQESRYLMTFETWAWRWARANALMWTPAMERHMVACLAWYRPRAAKLDRIRWADNFPSIAEQMARWREEHDGLAKGSDGV
jgi:hypothetical protein